MESGYLRRCSHCSGFNSMDDALQVSHSSTLPQYQGPEGYQFITKGINRLEWEADWLTAG